MSILAALTVLCLGADPVHYSISFENAVHHEAEISITWTDLPDEPLHIVVSRSSPGRYAIHDFAKNVYGVSAEDGAGRRRDAARVTPHEWKVSRHDGTVTFRYTLFGDRVDGTFTAVDETHAHLNMPATFAWARGQENRPIRLSIDVADRDWRVATQLQPAGSSTEFEAPDLYYFLDSPIECSAFDRYEWIVPWDDRRPTIEMALHTNDSETDRKTFFEMSKYVVAELTAVFGELPAFDHGRYTFLADYLPYASGDGMEHRNSTILTSSRSLSEDKMQLLGTVSHEFIHAWSMERIRAKALEPFNFDGINMSEELWFGEGFTSYYDELAVHRAGLTTLDEYLESLAGHINAIRFTAARRYHSAADMSRLATFTDRAGSTAPTNLGNTFVSYYTYGAAIALGLDLTLRTRYDTDLDAFMALMWQTHGKSEKPYTHDDLVAALGQVAGSEPFARDYFDRIVEGREIVDYEGLAEIGLLLRPKNPEKAYWGSPSLSFEDGAVILESYPKAVNPLYIEGLEKGARITSINGVTPASSEELDELFQQFKPGETIRIDYSYRGTDRTTELRLMADPTLEIVPYELAEMPVTDAMRALRSAWLGSKSPHLPNTLTRACDACNRTFELDFAYCPVDGEALDIELALANE